MSTMHALATDERGSGQAVRARRAQKVVIVNGSLRMADLVSTVLEAGRYELVFVESNAHAYSQTKRIMPQLVFLYADMDDDASFLVLSKLKLDATTKDIPVLLDTNDPAHPDDEEDLAVPVQPESMVMN